MLKFASAMDIGENDDYGSDDDDIMSAADGKAFADLLKKATSNS